MDKDETEEEEDEMSTSYQTSYTTSILEDARSIIDSTLFEQEDNDDANNRLVSYTCLSSSVNIDQNFYDGGIMCDWFIMVPMLKDDEEDEQLVSMEEDQ
jgi:hypothetical protein